MGGLHFLLLSLLLTVHGKPLEDPPMPTPGIPYQRTPVDSPVHYDLPLPTEGAESRNPPFTEEGYRLYEGDMILSEEQVDALYGKENPKKAIGDLEYRWPNGYIPYEIDQSSEPNRKPIQDALQHWMSNTCLKFKEVPKGSKGFHLIFKKKTGCNSQVGRSWYWHPDGQDVSIGDGCEGMGTIAHEVGHAIGFYHEQSRPDRDQFVKIFLDNVKESSKFNFDLMADANNYGVPYDLGSLMHYGLDYFTINGKNTMVPLDPMRQFEIGQRVGLSFSDIKLANTMYNCSAQCTSKPNCKNGGYVDQLCKCRCPPNTQGTSCETTLPPPKPKCGGIMSSPGTIKSPNYPQKYPGDSKCVWWIKAPQGKKVTAYFKTFDVLQRHTDGVCHWDSVEVRTGSKLEGTVYCEKELQAKGLASTTNEMLILFKSQYDWSTGFEIEINFK